MKGLSKILVNSFIELKKQQEPRDTVDNNKQMGSKCINNSVTVEFTKNAPLIAYMTYIARQSLRYPPLLWGIVMLS